MTTTVITGVVANDVIKREYSHCSNNPILLSMFPRSNPASGGGLESGYGKGHPTGVIPLGPVLKVRFEPSGQVVLGGRSLLTHSHISSLYFIPAGQVGFIPV